MMHSIPGGPFTRERPVPPEILRALNAKYNLDDPLPIQYLNYHKISQFHNGRTAHVLFDKIGMFLGDLDKILNHQ